MGRKEVGKVETDFGHSVQAPDPECVRAELEPRNRYLKKGGCVIMVQDKALKKGFVHC